MSVFLRFVSYLSDDCMVTIVLLSGQTIKLKKRSDRYIARAKLLLSISLKKVRQKSQLLFFKDMPVRRT